MAAKKRAPADKRVQGIDSSLSELKLRSGREFAVEIGKAILPTPTLTRTIGGASSISLDVRDPKLELLDSALLAETFDAQLDGLWFRYMGTSKSGKTLTITLQERAAAKLRELKGPKKAYRSEVTRAEFIISLVREAGIPFYCPELHVKPPIKTEAQADKAKVDARENRGKGIGEAKHLTIDGAKATKEQINLGETAMHIAASVNASFRVRVALIAALMAESSMGSASPGNVLQALGSGGAPIGSAAEEISGFLTGDPEWTGVTAIGYAKANPEATFSQIAQAVQKSAFSSGSNYAKFGSEAREWVETFDGEGGTGDIEVTEPYTFEVGKKENYWEAIKRLAQEVNWRAFFVAGRFFFISEDELIRSQVRLAIVREPGQAEPETPGIEDVDFDFNSNKAVTEVTVTAYAKQWGVPPGSVVTLKGYGPASLGFGDAPVKADSKGRKAGLSSNRNAKTGEGRGRYLVASIETPLRDTDDSTTRLLTIKLKKPTSPLPESQAETHSVSGSSASSTADALADVRITSTQPGAPSWGGAAAVFKQFVHPFMEDHGLSPGAEKEQGHAPDGDHDPEGQPSGYATDYPTGSGEQIAHALAVAMGFPAWQPNSYTSFTITVDGSRFEVQILWGAGIEHGDHIHVGMHRI